MVRHMPKSHDPGKMDRSLYKQSAFHGDKKLQPVEAKYKDKEKKSRWRKIRNHRRTSAVDMS